MINLCKVESSMIPIVTINYNGSKDTICLIESLIASKEIFHLVIVDNDSPKEGEFETINHYLIKNKWDIIDSNSNNGDISEIASICKYKLKEFFITFLQSKNNNGFAKGTNIGLKYILTENQFKYVAILNNDTVVTEYFATKIVERMEKYHLSAAMGTILYYGYDKPYIWSIGGYVKWIRGECVHEQKNEIFTGNSKELIYRGFVSGCFTIFNSKDLREINFLDEDYFFAGEEYQYSIDLAKKNKKMAWIPESIIYHKSVLGKGNGSSHTISELCWQFNAYMVKIVFVNKNKNALYRYFWHMIFKTHILSNVKKRYLKDVSYGKKAYILLKNELFKNINSRSFSYADFISFKQLIENNNV